ncbi:hypothetical protein GCM10025880_18850 [Methylorubrum aminovorans]|nr:hypothetical protein GCM10025880_18850 [Methylorubrum aminovorans]
MEVAYFAQHQLDELRPSESAVAHVRDRMPDAPEAKVRSAAARLGFPASKADTPVSQLSGGEKARLLMGLAAFDGPHLLILDEPTNHLDIESRQALVEAINDYEGAVILVSHDRFLIEACADRLWIVGNGSVKTFDGDMDDYRRLVLAGPERADTSGEGTGGQKAEARRSAVERRAALAPSRSASRRSRRAWPSSRARSRRSTRRSPMAPPSSRTRPRPGTWPACAPRRPRL